ncbi:MAG TPA: glycosyltransferase family 1 protein [Candidatus Omnitrophota bacterium]|nr:glycosyltransferase family 1 protein [Candidatus Omnitrophota bacterium]
MQHRVGIDIRMLKHTGIGTYLRGILSGFEGLDLDKGLDLSVFGPDLMERCPSFYFHAPIYSIQEQWQYPPMLSHCKLWHAPHYNVPLLKGKTKLVVTIHDIIHWIFRKQFLTPLQTLYAGFMLRKAVHASDHIIAVSQHTKKDLIEHFQADEKKITVIHEGVGNEFRLFPPEEKEVQFQKLKTKYHLPEDYFLYVGMLKPHKNVQKLIRLFSRLKAQNKVKASLVLIGRKDLKYPQGFEDVRDLSSSANMIHLPAIDYGELPIIYNQAIALIHPSLYEGFGLTLVEAMRCGTPVLCSNTSSIPEVVGDAAMLVDPTSESEMMEKIMELEQNQNLRDSLRQKGMNRATRFDWKETARHTAMVYERVLGQK